MVTAYLRGLLKPHMRYGLRSHMAETLILEAVAADIHSKALETTVLVDAAMMPVIKHDSRREYMQSLYARASRVTELMEFDVHRLAKKARIDDTAGERKISLVQLYQLLDKKGILAAMKSRDESTRQ